MWLSLRSCVRTFLFLAWDQAYRSVADVVSDTILIVAPVSLLLRARLTRPLKIRLVSVFAATSITTAVSLWHAYAVLRIGGLWEIVAAVAQVRVSVHIHFGFFN